MSRQRIIYCTSLLDTTAFLIPYKVLFNTIPARIFPTFLDGKSLLSTSYTQFNYQRNKRLFDSVDTEVLYGLSTWIFYIYFISLGRILDCFGKSIYIYFITGCEILHKIGHGKF